MGTVVTDRVIPAAFIIENHGAPGTFGLVSRDPTQPIFIDLAGARGGETIEIDHIGDSTSFDLLGIDQITIRAASYPTQALINLTPLSIELTAAPYTSAAPPGASGVHRDVTITLAGSTVLWTPSVGKRFVVTSLILSTDTAQRVAAVDGADVAGSRIAAPYLAAAGGLIYTGPYVSAAANNALRIITAAAGNVFASVDGYETL